MNEETKENLNILKERADKISSDYFELDDKMRNRKIQVEDQRRSFYQSIALLILAILGSTYFLQISHSSRLYFSGACLWVFVIIFIILHLREVIDTEANSLVSLMADWKKGFDEKFALVIKYLESGNYTKEKIQEYFENDDKLPAVQRIRERADKDKAEAQSNILDYSGELIIFLFLSGLFLILGSIIPNYFNWIIVVLGEVVLLFISCANTARYISDSFSKFVDRLIKVMFK